jgi:prepilin-type processing-associated H-X9-DG protein
VELLVVIAIIGVLVGLLLPAVQAAREAARRMQCSNNLKQMGLAVHNFDSTYKKLPTSGQCGSTGSTTTPYMIHSTATYLLPYIEQQNLYNMFNMQANPVVAYGASPSGAFFLTPSGCLLHSKAKGLAYDDPAWPSGNVAAKTTVPTFVCPSTPIAGIDRDPQGYGCFDYMFIDLTDICEDPANPLYGERTVPTGGPVWLTQVRQGMLSADSGSLARTVDGTSNTILCIEDAGRANPSVGQYGSLSTRRGAVSNPIDPIPAMGGSLPGRRMYAWADADCVTNGLSGPSNSTGSRKAGINKYANPKGGPPECLWSVNNCGPNDEPFSFHTGGANALYGDGSVKFLSDTVDPIVLKWTVAASDGNVVPNID